MTQSTIEQMREALEQIAAYPKSPADEMSAQSMRALARKAISNYALQVLADQAQELDMGYGAAQPASMSSEPNWNQHEVADAFWKSWKLNDDSHKHGYYESTWIALRAAYLAASANPSPMSNERPDIKTIAWLHDGEGRIDVCHNEEKELWLAVKPKHVEHYTIALHTKEDAQSAANEFFGAYYKKRFEEAIASFKPAPVSSDQDKPTDISLRLREYASNPGYSHNDYTDTMRAAANEIERYYGGMLAWKRTAETKDRKLSEEMTARANERIAARVTPVVQPEAAQPAPKVTSHMMNAGADVWRGREGFKDKSIQYLCKRIFEAMIDEQPAPMPVAPAANIDTDDLWHVLSVWADSRGYQGEKRSQKAEDSEDAVLARINTWHANNATDDQQVKGWISVKDRLPEDRQDVLFIVDCPSGLFEYLHGRRLGGRYVAANGGFCVPGLTISASRWMSMPPAPTALTPESKP